MIFFPDYPCDATKCPEVWCGLNLQYIPEGQCCPMCPTPSAATTIPISAGCTEPDGSHYREGETWQRSPCVTCTCEIGMPVCSPMQCVPLPCADYTTLPGHCCPMCLPQAMPFPPVYSYRPVQTTNCQEGDKQYKNVETWFPNKNDPCMWGYCDKGKISYLTKHCDIPNCNSPIYIPYTCCPICPGKKTFCKV